MEKAWVIRGIVLAVVIAVVAVVLFAGGEDEVLDPADIEPEVEQVVTADELAEFASDADFPIHWAEEIEGREIELVLYEEFSALVSYLDEEQVEAAEAAAADALAIGTYPMEDPEAAMELMLEEDGAIVRESDDGRTVVTNRGNQRSVYFADEEQGVQVEVFHPDPRSAMRLALSDAVRPVE